MARLAQFEAREPEVWLADDYRIAWLTVLHAHQDIPDPWGFAFWRYLGRTYGRVLPEFMAREQRHAAMELPPKKPSQPEKQFQHRRKRR